MPVRHTSVLIPSNLYFTQSLNCQRAARRNTEPVYWSNGNGQEKSAGDIRDSFRSRRSETLLEISRKEVIQPQVPLRLPCYDFAPVTELTFGGCLLAVSPPTLGPPSFHGVTGGVYKARERIHRGMADPRLLAIPASCGRVAAHNPNLDRLLAIGILLRASDALYRPL
jgi:hypothetical protein